MVGNTHRLLALFEDFGVRGTFFVLGVGAVGERRLGRRGLGAGRLGAVARLLDLPATLPSPVRHVGIARPAQAK